MENEKYLFVVSGAAGTGKDSVVNALRKAHPEIDALYLAATTPQGKGIWRFESGETLLPYRWRSKTFFTSSL